MKIVQINTVCGIGSTGRIVTDIHAALIAKGFDSHVMYGRGEARSCNKAIKIGDQKDFYWHVLQTRIFDTHGFCSIKATQSALKKLDELRPNIVHIHNIHGYYINIELLFLYLRARPHIKIFWTLHDCWPFTGHCAYFDLVRCDKWKTGCFSCPQKNNYPASKVIDNSKTNYLRKKAAFLGVDNLTIITPSQWLANLVKESYFKEKSVKVINNGIDLDIFCHRNSNFRERYNLTDKFLIMGAASDWSPRKGFDDFISLSKLLPSYFQIIMIGLSLEIIKKLPSNILGICRTDNAIELAEIYSAADVFFNPTYEDNFPTVNLEAIACGTPVITYNTGGSPESVLKENGFVVEQGELASVVEIVNKLSETPLDMMTIPVNFNKVHFVDTLIATYKL